MHCETEKKQIDGQKESNTFFQRWCMVEGIFPLYFGYKPQPGLLDEVSIHLMPNNLQRM